MLGLGETGHASSQSPDDAGLGEPSSSSGDVLANAGDGERGECHHCWGWSSSSWLLMLLPASLSSLVVVGSLSLSLLDDAGTGLVIIGLRLLEAT